MITIKDIAEKLLKAKNIAIFGHISPDFDCFGSVFSLCEGLIKLNKNAKIFIDGELKDSEKELFNDKYFNSVQFKKEDYDLLIFLDTPNKYRAGKYGSMISGHKNILKLDHHEELKTDLTKKFYIKPDAASCSMLVLELLTEMKCPISRKIATYIYAGLLGDTNSFVNDNVNAECFENAYKLVKKGADVVLCNKIYFKSKEMTDWKLKQIAYKKAEFFNEFAIVAISNKEIKKLRITGNNMSAFANELSYLKHINIGCTITEKNPNEFSVSFRSKRGYDVELIATELGGGGHKQASACVINGKMKDVKSKIIVTISDYLRKRGKND